MERVLYNGLLAAISLDGASYFNTNVLKVERRNAPSIDHSVHRQKLHTSNPSAPELSGLLASLGQYAFAQGESEIIIHHYLQGRAVFQVADHAVVLSQTTRYPWEGRIRLQFELASPAEFAVKLRLPAWCTRYALLINDQVITAEVQRGYLNLRRTWQNEDDLVLDMQMPVQRIYAHSKVTANRGRVALQRGPIVYCLEAMDNGENLESILLPRTAALEYAYDPALLGGVVTVEADALREGSDSAEGQNSAYLTRALALQNFRLKAVPYFAWDNRVEGDMLVWLRESNQ
jgi:hypothetical protein